MPIPESGRLHPSWSSTKPSGAVPWCGASPPSRSTRPRSTASWRPRCARRRRATPEGRPGWSCRGPTETAAYFEATTDEAWRTRNAAWSEGLARAPVVLLAYTSPDAYVARYSEGDKAVSGLGAGQEAWPVPYWVGDAAFGVMTVLLGAVDAGLGACILGHLPGRGGAGRAAGRARRLAPLLRRAPRAAPMVGTTARHRSTAPAPAPPRESTTSGGDIPHEYLGSRGCKEGRMRLRGIPDNVLIELPLHIELCHCGGGIGRHADDDVSDVVGGPEPG